MGKRKTPIFDIAVTCGSLIVVAIILIVFAFWGESSSPKSNHAAVSDTINTQSDILPDINNYTVCIDAGRGGIEAGYNKDSNGNSEAELNLEFAILLKDELTRQGITVVMTRETDLDEETKLSLEERADIASKADSDILISLHKNAYDGKNASSVYGVEAWVKSSKPDEDIELAEKMLTALEQVGVTKNRDVKIGSGTDATKDQGVNQYTGSMPSIILYMGYITSSKDNDKYDQNKVQYAQELAKCISDYLEN